MNKIYFLFLFNYYFHPNLMNIFFPQNNHHYFLIFFLYLKNPYNIITFCLLRLYYLHGVFKSCKSLLILSNVFLRKYHLIYIFYYSFDQFMMKIIYFPYFLYKNPSSSNNFNFFNYQDYFLLFYLIFSSYNFSI